MMRSEQIPRIKEKILDAFRKQVFKKMGEKTEEEREGRKTRQNKTKSSMKVLKSGV